MSLLQWLRESFCSHEWADREGKEVGRNRKEWTNVVCIVCGRVERNADRGLERLAKLKGPVAGARPGRVSVAEEPKKCG